MENDQGAEKAKEQKRDYLLPASILIAAFMISGSIMYMVGAKNAGDASGNGKQTAQVGQNLPSTEPPKISERDVLLGDPQAPVSLIEYGDYQCPFCGRFFSQTESQIRENYIKTGKVKMAYRNFVVVDSFVPGGRESADAAEAAECAKDQKQFWAYHDLLYKAEVADGEENNGNLNRTFFMKLAGELKLDTKAFAACFDAGKYAELIKKDSADARVLGVNSTPTLYVGGEKFLGALPYGDFASAIENALAGK